MRRITSAGPSITEAEIELVTEAIREGWQDKRNWYIDRFVEEFSAQVDRRFCLPTAHCTDAIHLAMLGLGLGPGDEVVVPELTWVASASPVLYVGAVPVFCDVDPITWCMTPETLEAAITSRTKAVVVVDLLGNMPNWDGILEVCQRHGLAVIEDAAEGLGATASGRPAGSFGDVSLFSFNATKLVMAGQGGALCTDDPELYERARSLSHHGINQAATGRYYWSTELGYNYDWTNLQAALGLAQLRRIDDLIAYKVWLFREYEAGLGGVEGIRLNDSGPGVVPTYWITAAILDEGLGWSKEDLCLRFADYGIDMRPLFYPLSSMPTFAATVEGRSMVEANPVAYELSSRGICLPNGNNLDADDVAYVIEAFLTILKG